MSCVCENGSAILNGITLAQLDALFLSILQKCRSHGLLDGSRYLHNWTLVNVLH